jgi:8-oxo-dGTP pyrophosphatase MutT (NUDIX family)
MTTTMRRAFSVAVYARRGDRVLVIDHRRTKLWLPIGGEMEPGETPLEAAQRELMEETGLTASFVTLEGHAEGEPPGYIGYEEHVTGVKGLHMNFVFVADVAAGVEVRPNEEFERFRWVTAEELAALHAPKNVYEFGVRAFAARAKVLPAGAEPT